MPSPRPLAVRLIWSQLQALAWLNELSGTVFPAPPSLHLSTRTVLMTQSCSYFSSAKAQHEIGFEMRFQGDVEMCFNWMIEEQVPRACMGCLAFLQLALTSCLLFKPG